MDAGATGLDHGSQHVHVAAAPLHALLILDPAQQSDLVTQLGGALEIQVDSRPLHGGGKLLGQGVAAPFEKHHRMTYILGIFGRLDQADAGSLAAPDLMLQAGTRPVSEVAVLALADLKGLLQKTQAFAY